MTSRRANLSRLGFLCVATAIFIAVSGCKNSAEISPVTTLNVDTLIINGLVYDGTDSEPRQTSVGITDDRIVFIGDHRSSVLTVDNTIDASGKLVAPGFIDPHTHADAELKNPTTSQNLNYLTQGVTTVLIGNDGYGTPQVHGLAKRLTANGIGTNVGFLVGHGEVRDQVMGKADRAPSQKEQSAMMQLVESAMQEGALGLSSGLYYRPGSFAATGELAKLATVAAQYGGLYESHIRDESSYNIGLIAAIQEALDIGREAGLPVHISHIKALGVDVWGESATVIAMIEAARAAGNAVTADQYPWRASGTHLDNALVSRWAMAGSDDEFHARLEDPMLRPRIVAEMRNNLRIRGGPDALLIATCPEPSMVGKTLAEVALERAEDPIDVALMLLVAGSTRVISFNMNPPDIQAFMSQPWVMTSSDGNDGHPRKYASYPRKYRDYVVKQNIMPVHTFFHRSSGLVAETFGLKNRGYLRTGYFADISIIDPETFSPQADFDHWNRLSTGIDYLFVNGALAIDGGEGTSALSGRALRRGQ